MLHLTEKFTLTEDTWNRYRKTFSSNRLTNWWSGGSATTSIAYTYDTQDQRVSQSVKVGSSATSTTNYWNRYYETSGATSTAYVFAGDQLVATVEGNGVSTSTSVTHTDHLNGTNVTSSASGTVLQRLTYTPYGAVQTNTKTGTNDTKRKYIGQYYDGVRGQFLAQDPIARDIANTSGGPGYILDANGGATPYSQLSVLSDPQLLNSYSYSANNPINKKDPSGLSPLHAAAIGAAGGAVFSIAGNLTINAYQNLSMNRPVAEMFLPAAGSNSGNLSPGVWYANEAKKAALAGGTLAAIGSTLGSGALIAANTGLATYSAYTNSDNKSADGKTNWKNVGIATAVGAASGIIAVMTPSVPGPWASPANLLTSSRAVSEYAGNIGGTILGIMNTPAVMTYDSKSKQKTQTKQQ